MPSTHALLAAIAVARKSELVYLNPKPGYDAIPVKTCDLTQPHEISLGGRSTVPVLFIFTPWLKGRIGDGDIGFRRSEPGICPFRRD